MWYFGLVTPKGFVDRLGSQLKRKSDLPEHRRALSKSLDKARLLIPLPGELNSLIRVTVESIDFGSGLLIEMDFAEIDALGSERRAQTTRGDIWFRVILCPSEHKRLREVCAQLAGMISGHIKDMQYMQISDFIN